MANQERTRPSLNGDLPGTPSKSAPGTPSSPVPGTPLRDTRGTPPGTPLQDIRDVGTPSSVTSAEESSFLQASSETQELRKKYKKKRNSGGINDYHLYRKFRLHMVEAFGSLAASFYELEREARARLPQGLGSPRGEISRRDFDMVINQKMHLFDTDETESLFMFLINADINETSEGCKATFKHFGVSEVEWAAICKQKELEGQGQQSGMFASTQSGVSTGIYLRPMRVESASRRKGPAKVQERPWQQSQKKWEPATLAGQGPPLKCEDVVAVNRGRRVEFTVSIAPSDKGIRQPKQHVLGKPLRKKCSVDEAFNGISGCPTRRSEMVPQTSALSIPWWPYKSKPRRIHGHKAYKIAFESSES